MGDRVVPSDAELHRAAAWWAGEGSVSGKNRKLVVTFSQKEHCVCEWFGRFFGGTVSTRPKTSTKNEISCWSAHGENARKFIGLIVDLIPESPKRQAQLRLALEVTAGRLKTGPKPSVVCQRGHQKEGGRCKQCAAIWRATRSAKPGFAEKHRQQERDRYRNNPETKSKALARAKAQRAAA